MWSWVQILPACRICAVFLFVVFKVQCNEQIIGNRTITPSSPPSTPLPYPSFPLLDQAVRIAPGWKRWGQRSLSSERGCLRWIEPSPLSLMQVHSEGGVDKTSNSWTAVLSLLHIHVQVELFKAGTIWYNLFGALLHCVHVHVHCKIVCGCTALFTCMYTWVCEESWLAIKLTVPVPNAGHLNVLFISCLFVCALRV